jgi:uncharacterized protein YceK
MVRRRFRVATASCSVLSLLSGCVTTASIVSPNDHSKGQPYSASAAGLKGLGMAWYCAATDVTPPNKYLALVGMVPLTAVYSMCVAASAAVETLFLPVDLVAEPEPPKHMPDSCAEFWDHLRSQPRPTVSDQELPSP